MNGESLNAVEVEGRYSYGAGSSAQLFFLIEDAYLGMYNLFDEQKLRIEYGGDSAIEQYDFPLYDYTLPSASTATKGGVKIGKGLAMYGDTLNCTLQNGEYKLPTASTTTKGGIKVGNGLAMNGDTLNCTISGNTIITTIPSTVEGAIWIEVI